MPPQIKRLLLIAVVLVGVFAVARYLLTPASFGKNGHYRADAIAEVQALPISYAGADKCAACHGDVVELKDASKHARIACESCHGPALKHTEDPTSVKPIKPRADREFCGRCHSKNAARPRWMPQVDLDLHNAGMECFLCHKPHAPTINNGTAGGAGE